jgi:hypothetical protein
MATPAVFLVLWGGTPGAASAATSYPTTVQYAAATCSGGSCTIVGSLSTTRKCQWLRKVQLYERRGSGLVHLDTILSSGQGAWAFRYPQTSQLRFVVTDAVRFNGDVICQGTTQDQTLAALTRRTSSLPSPVADQSVTPGAALGTTSYPTTIKVGPGECSPGGSCHIAVTLETTRKCQWLRKVKLYKRTGGPGLVHLDTILSSGQGAAGFSYPSELPTRVNLRFVVSDALRFGGDVGCEASTLDFRF